MRGGMDIFQKTDAYVQASVMARIRKGEKDIDMNKVEVEVFAETSSFGLVDILKSKGK